jgi:hypothetical protein
MPRHDTNAFPAGWVLGASPEETAAALAERPLTATPHARPTIQGTRAALRKGAPAAAVPASAPYLQKRVQPLLNRGADMRIASEGFRDGEQFAALAHAARNADIPFMLLKHHVLNDGQTLTEAIHSSKPDVNAALEAERAHAEARSDVAPLD